MKHGLSGFVAVIFSALVLWLGWWKYEDFLTQGSRPPEGTRKLNQIEKEGAPNFSLEDLEGERIELSHFKNKIVILNFWASWCEPCVEEFPSLISLVKQMKGDVVLLAISADHDRDSLESFIRSFDVRDSSIKIMWDRNQKIASLFGTEVLPESYILGYDNKVLRKVAGIDKWDTPQAVSFFQELINTQQK